MQPVAYAKYLDRNSYHVKYYYHLTPSQVVAPRGAIVWPQTLSPTTTVEGVAIVSAKNIATQVVSIYEQFPFIDLTTRVEDGDITPGLIEFLNKAMSKYLCTTFFWAGDEEIHKRYRKQLYRSQALKTRPLLVHAPYADNDLQCQNLVLESVIKSCLQIQQDSMLAEQLLMESELPTERNAIRALNVLMAGYERRSDLGATMPVPLAEAVYDPAIVWAKAWLDSQNKDPDEDKYGNNPPETPGDTDA